MNYKLVFFTITTSLLFNKALSQVGIGTTNIDKSAVLEIQSSNQGFLMPRMTAIQKQNIANPTDGLMVYSTNSCTNGGISVYSAGQWKMMPACPDIDFDDDGIPNNLDIDDDNDGILDVLEKQSQAENFEYGPSVPATHLDFNWANNTPTTGSLSDFSYATSPVGTSGVISWTNLRAVRVRADDKLFRITSYKASNVPPTGYGEFNISIPSPNESSDNNVEVTSNPLIIGDIDNDFTFDITITTTEGIITDINEIEQSVTNGNNGTTGISTITDQGGGVFRVSVDFIAKNTGSGSDGCDFRLDVVGKYVTNYFIDIFSSSTAPGDQIKIPVTRSVLTNLDPDGDGMPSHLDLDSDNDGCSDAFEAGSTTNTTANFNYTNTDVGTNGLSNSIENFDLQSGINISTIDTTNAYNSAVNTCP
ncbi:MAG: hypothetical protein ACPGSD_17905 [Flavobacteriales bacterium]